MASSNNKKKRTGREQVKGRLNQKRKRCKERRSARWVDKILAGKMTDLPRRCINATGISGDLKPRGVGEGRLPLFHVDAANRRGTMYLEDLLCRDE